MIAVLADLFIARGTPGYIRSDNGPEFVATAVKGWINGVGAKTAFIGRAARGRTATWKASTASCATSC